MDVELENFAKIGMVFTEPYQDDIKRISNNVKILEKNKEEITDKVESIPVESDGADEEELSAERLFGTNIKIERKHNACALLLSTIYNDTRELLETLYYDKEKRSVMKIIFNNMCQSGKKLNTYWFYNKETIDNMYNDYLSVINGLKILNLNKPETYIKAIYGLSDNLKNIFGSLPDVSFKDIFPQKHSNSIEIFRSINNILYNLRRSTTRKNDAWKLLLAKAYGLTPNNEESYISEIVGKKLSFIDTARENIRFVGSQKVTLKKQSITIDDAVSLNNLDILLRFYSNLLKYFIFIILEVIEDVQSILKVIEPLSLNDVEKKDTLMADIENINPWISSDYHFLGELIKGEEAIDSKTIIKMHNKVVKPNDVFLFLGDITESEFTLSLTRMREVGKLVKKLNGIKIILLGNNDTSSEHVYHEMGFVEVYRTPIETKNYIFSHRAIPTKGKLNIHGDNHGSKIYTNDIDPKNHIDCYFGLWDGPVKLTDLVSYYKQGLYKGSVYDSSEDE